MKFFELEPQFLRISGENTFEHVVDLASADGVMFLCPKCFTHNNGSVGTHSVLCWRPHVSLEFPPGAGRWELTGTGFQDLTLRPSVWLQGSFCVRPGCEASHTGGDNACTDPRCEGWHGVITDGEVTL